jgi:hypothetical protein
MRAARAALVIVAAAAFFRPGRCDAQLFIVDKGAGTVGEYTTSGTPINANLITGLNNPEAIVISGSQLFVSSFGLSNGFGGGEVGEYTIGSTPGTIASSSPALVTGLFEPNALAISGSNLFVADVGQDTVGEYSTSGLVENASLVQSYYPEGIAVQGNNLFMLRGQGDMYEYGVSNATVTSTTYLTGVHVGQTASALEIVGSTMYVAQYGDGNLTGVISEFDTSGNPINSQFITDLDGPVSIANAGTDLFVVNSTASVVGEYTTSGMTISHGLEGPELDHPYGIAAISPEPASGMILLVSAFGLLARAPRERLRERPRTRS